MMNSRGLGFIDGVCRWRSEYSTCVHTQPGTLVRCLLNTTMVSNNHTITLKIHEERQSLLANTLAWPVGSHKNTSCLWNITSIDNRCCSSYGTALEKHGLLDNPRTTCHNDTTLYCGLHHCYTEITKISNIWDFSEIKCMRTTVCTRRSSLPLLQIGTPGYEASYTHKLYT